MHLVLTPDLERLVAAEIASGAYETADAVIRDALKLLRANGDRLRRDVEVGLAQLDRGDFTEYDLDRVEKLAQDVKTRGRQRLARSSPK